MEGDPPVPQCSEDRVVLPHVDNLIDDLRDRFLRCQVCTQLYVTDQRCPKVLPCGHGLCSDCIQQAFNSKLKGVQCRQCSPVRVVYGQPAPDRTHVELMELINKFTPDVHLGEEQPINPSVPDTAASFLTTLREQILTCKICEHAFDSEDHKLVTLSCQHELCCRCEAKMGEEGRHECPFCRKAFYRHPGSPEDMLPAQLLKWLQPFLPALSSMTSSPADAFLDRLISLHEILEKNEHKMMQTNNPEDFVHSFGRIHLGFDTPNLRPSSARGGAPPDEGDLICTQFANDCNNVMRECLNAETVSSQEVWTILSSVLNKMKTHAIGKRKVREAMLEVGALQLLVQDCWDRQFLNQLSTEKKVHLIQMTWEISKHILSKYEVPKRLQTNDSVLKMLVEKVEADGIEDGVTLKATELLQEITENQECKHTFADILAQLRLPARFVRICQVAHATESAGDDVRKETIYQIYFEVQNLTYYSEAFSAAVIDAGMLPLLVDACTQLENAPRQDKWDISGRALNIIDNISRFPNLHRHLVEKDVISLLMPCMKHVNKGLAMLTTFILAQLCTSHEDVKSFQEHFNKEEVLIRMKSWTESALTNSQGHFKYPDSQCEFPTSDFLECMRRVAHFPGLATKVVESGWLELLCRLLDEGKEEEKRLVLDCLLTLSQSPDVGGRLAENEALLAKVRALQTEDTHSQASSLLLSRLQQQDKMAASQAGH